MDEFVARQAVFDAKLKVAGYELLFRSGPENYFTGQDGTRASQQVIERALNTFGLGRLAVGARAFINITPELLMGGFASLLQLAVAYEQAHWDQIPGCLDGLAVDISRLPGSYREAVGWADQLYKSGL